MNEKKLKTGPECSRTFSDKKKKISTKQKAHCKKFVMFFFYFFFYHETVWRVSSIYKN